MHSSNLVNTVSESHGVHRTALPFHFTQHVRAIGVKLQSKCVALMKQN